ncbi:GNAT family N-acetyltransferase [Virgibacillus natechei]
MDILIRQEHTREYNTTEEVVKKAFLNEEHSDQTEHLLVKRIRISDAFIPGLSLIAIDQDQDNEIIGQILLSKVAIVNDDKTAKSLALAPVSVIPAYQKKGIGSQLIHAALIKAKEIGYHSVIVLGHNGSMSRNWTHKMLKFLNPLPRFACWPLS